MRDTITGKECRYNWSAAPAWAMWATTNKDGHRDWWARAPVMDESLKEWVGDGEYLCDVAGPTECLDWRQSIEYRPK